jgi:hypothetical protein
MATARAPDDFATPTAFTEHVEEVVTRLRYHAGMEFDTSELERRSLWSNAIVIDVTPTTGHK